MNISEANAINVVCRGAFGAPASHGRPPTAEELQAAVDVLLRGAHRTLSAGLKPGDVTIGGTG